MVVSDYGKGVITLATLERALGAARRDRLSVCVDPKESHIDAYRGVSILTPNQHEAGYMQGRATRCEDTDPRGVREQSIDGARSPFNLLEVVEDQKDLTLVQPVAKHLGD